MAQVRLRDGRGDGWARAAPRAHRGEHLLPPPSASLSSSTYSPPRSGSRIENPLTEPTDHDMAHGKRGGLSDWCGVPMAAAGGTQGGSVDASSRSSSSGDGGGDSGGGSASDPGFQPLLPLAVPLSSPPTPSHRPPARLCPPPPRFTGNPSPVAGPDDSTWKEGVCVPSLWPGAVERSLEGASAVLSLRQAGGVAAGRGGDLAFFSPQRRRRCCCCQRDGTVNGTAAPQARAQACLAPGARIPHLRMGAPHTVKMRGHVTL